jgi:hypothetical protein
MKTFNLTILILLVALTAFSKQNPEKNHVSVKTVKREIFYFKVDKQFLGATVNVYNKQGMLIVTEKVARRKNIIDFFDQYAGTYTIVITKGELVETFECMYGIR